MRSWIGWGGIAVGEGRRWLCGSSWGWYVRTGREGRAISGIRAELRGQTEELVQIRGI